MKKIKAYLKKYKEEDELHRSVLCVLYDKKSGDFALHYGGDLNMLAYNIAQCVKGDERLKELINKINTYGRSE